MVKGISKGTATDASGNFSLSVTNPNSTLIISALGYEGKEINLEGRTSVTIDLSPATKQLDQVVIVGYGAQRKIDITGSVSQVKGEEISKQSGCKNEIVY